MTTPEERKQWAQHWNYQPRSELLSDALVLHALLVAIPFLLIGCGIYTAAQGRAASVMGGASLVLLEVVVLILAWRFSKSKRPEDDEELDRGSRLPEEQKQRFE